MTSTPADLSCVVSPYVTPPDRPGCSGAGRVVNTASGLNGVLSGLFLD